MSKIDFYILKYFRTAGLLSLAILVFSAADLNAQITIGDLSDDISSPSLFSIGSSSQTLTISNSVFESDLSTGVTGNLTGDVDFFNIVVAPGFQLDSISLDSFDGGGQAFFGFAENQLGGNSALAAEQGAFVASALGFTLLDGGETGSLFADLALGAQGTLPSNAFDPNQSLGPGTFAFVFQNTGPNTNNFALTFDGSAAVVPEPASVLAVVGMGLGLVARRRRRR